MGKKRKTQVAGDVNAGKAVVADTIGVVNMISPAESSRALSPLHQLPAPPADFTGRQAELKQLHAAVAAGGLTISGLRGQGGIGKTALALVLARDLAPHYPDAEIFLNLRGIDATPVTPAEAMQHVIRAFHPEAKLPAELDQLAPLYQSVLHEKCVLLLMDNARDAAQVKPLVPPAGCLLLVTSRVKFTLPGLHPVNLDKLPRADSIALLRQICPRLTNADADPLAAQCGDLPLALRLAASALSERPALSPADYMARLRDAQHARLKHLDKDAPADPHEQIEASLSLSESLLSPDLRSRWHALALFPESFDAPAAAAVWNDEIAPPPSEPGRPRTRSSPPAAEVAADALADLHRFSVLDFDPKEHRFRLHDLTRDFVAAKLTAESRQTAARRHADHYKSVAAAADDLYLAGGDNVVAALTLFDREWPNIRAGFAWAQSHSQTDDAAASLCNLYPDAGAYCLDLRLHPLEKIAWRTAALAAARRLKDRKFQGHHLGNLGNAYYRLGEPRRAIEFYEQWLTIAREIGDRRGEGNALGNLGNAYAALGEPRRAIEFYEQDLHIAREIGDRRGEGAVLGNLGIAYAALGEPRHAIECLEQDLAIAREIGDRRGEGNALGNLGNAYAALGEPHRAIEFYEQQLTITREIGDRLGEATASWNLGNAYEKAGDIPRAADLMQVCVDYERELGHPDAEKDAARVAEIRRRIASTE